MVQKHTPVQVANATFSKVTVYSLIIILLICVDLSATIRKEIPEREIKMTDEQKAAYVYAQSVAAQAEIEAMKALNGERARRGLSQVYDEQSFLDVIEKYGLNHNSVVRFFYE